MDGVGRLGGGTSGSTVDEAGSEDRRRKRDSLFLFGQLTIAGDVASHEVRVRNLSEGGLMIESHRAVEPGTTVALVIRGLGEITGHVAWVIEGRLGIALDRRIDPRQARKPVGNGAGTPEYAKPVLSSKPSSSR